MATDYVDDCIFLPASGGLTDFVYSSTVSGYRSPTQAGCVNGAVYECRAQSTDLSQWENFSGAFNSATGTFARTTIAASSTGAKVNFTNPPQVAVMIAASSIKAFLRTDQAQSFTALQQAQGCLNIGAVDRIKITVLTASGTWTPDANLKFAILEAVGGGAAGGGSVGNASFLTSGGGGGSGSPSRSYVTAATAGASQTVTIGAGGAAVGGGAGGSGGDTSIGTLCIGKGGSGGSAGTSGAFGAGGAGGVQGTGDWRGQGNAGQFGPYNSGAAGFVPAGAYGGASPLGGQAVPAVAANATNVGGNPGVGYGAGGTGSINNFNAATNQAGGNGQAGVAIIVEFCTN